MNDDMSQPKSNPINENINSPLITNQQINEIRNEIITELQQNGLISNNNKLSNISSKEFIRNLHKPAVKDMRMRFSKTLKKHEGELIEHIANGDEIDVNKIDPKLRYVDSTHELYKLFSYIKIHWSIPISSGYGRRLCYVVLDGYNNKAIGIIGLCDPVYSIASRDNDIGWDSENKRNNIKKVLDGFVIGAVPPYSMVLGGKLIASLLFSNQIREDFKKKYHGKTSVISGKKQDGEIVLITTLSALGKSAIYDRLRLPNGQRFISTGYSSGWGEFHFSGPKYHKMKFLVRNVPTKMTDKKKTLWGTGFRNKREVIAKARNILNIPYHYLRHEVKREQIMIPLTTNYRAILSNNEQPNFYNTPVDYIVTYMKNRWVKPRAKRDDSYLDWKREFYNLWN